MFCVVQKDLPSPSETWVLATTLAGRFQEWQLKDAGSSNLAPPVKAARAVLDLSLTNGAVDL